MMRKTYSTFLAALVLAGGISMAAPVPAGAFDLGGILDTALNGISAYKDMDKRLDYYDKTEEGRQEYFASTKKAKGVVDDPEHMEQISSIMGRLTTGVGEVDPSIYDKLYLYFICPDSSFNAFCSMGHIMCVNEGLFSYLTNDDEIAVVLGHEMGHGQKNHMSNAIRKKIKTEVAANIVSGSIEPTLLNNIILNVGVNQLETVTIDRGDESEADELSFDYIYHAGYNPGAAAGIWQRLIERAGDNDPTFAVEVFAPSDHPSNSDRRDTAMKRLTKLSKGHVKIKDGSDTVQVNGKDFVTPAPSGDMSGAERKYFVVGNLAAAYDHKENEKPAVAKDGTVYLGDQNIMTPAAGDPSAEELAKLLNEIK